MTLVLDAGGLISLERDERASWVRLKTAYLRGEVPLTTAAVLGQVWRGDRARLAYLRLCPESTSVHSTTASEERPVSSWPSASKRMSSTPQSFSSLTTVTRSSQPTPRP